MWCVVIFTQTLSWHILFIRERFSCSVCSPGLQVVPFEAEEQKIINIATVSWGIAERGHPGVAASNICVRIKNTFTLHTWIFFMFGVVPGFVGFSFKHACVRVQTGIIWSLINTCTCTPFKDTINSLFSQLDIPGSHCVPIELNGFFSCSRECAVIFKWLHYV